MPDTENSLDKQKLHPDDELYGQSLDLPDDDYKPPSPHKNKKPLPKFVLIALIIVVVLALVGGAVWFFLSNNDVDDDTAATTQSVQETEELPDPSADGTDVTSDFEPTTERTTSPRMDVTYPDTWTLTDEGDDVSIVSPRFSFTTLAGEEVSNGYFKLYIRQSARDTDSGYIGRAVAALPSQQISYDNPSTEQRQETLLQYFGIDAGNNLSFMMIAGNFQLSPGDTLGPDFGRDDGSYIIVGGYASDELEDDLQTHAVSAEYFRSTNAYEQAVDIIKSLGLL